MKPWEKYQTNQESDGPWSKYGNKVNAPSEVQEQLQSNEPQVQQPNSDKPNFMGEAVGDPAYGAKVIGKATDIAFKPVTETLRSNITTTAEDPFADVEGSGPSILDMSGNVFRGALRQGGASEVLIDDITKREDFGESADMVGRVITEFGIGGLYANSVVQFLGGINKARNLYNINKGIAKIERKIAKNIRTTFEKTVKPKKSGLASISLKEKYFKKANDAVINLTKNKKNFSFERAGVVEEGLLPQTMSEFEQVNNQARMAMFEKYDKMSTAAEKLKYQVDVDDLVRQLERFADDIVTQDAKPEMIEYANELVAELKMRKTSGQLTPKYAEGMIQAKNENLRLRRMSADTPTYHRAAVDEVYTKYMNEALDKTIEKLPGKAGEKYREFRNAYGAHAQISKDISNAATRLASAGPNVFQKGVDTFTGYHFLRGAMSRNMATTAAAGLSKGANAVEAWLNAPNRMITKMFETTENGLRKISTLTPIVQKAKAPKLPPPKQIGWDGTNTRIQSGETIYLGPEEYEPPGLMKAKIGGARSTTAKKVPTTIREAEPILLTETEKLLPSQMKSAGISESQFRSELISEEMRDIIGKPRQSVTKKVPATRHPTEPAYKSKEVPLRPDQIATLRKRALPVSKTGRPLMVPATEFIKSNIPNKLRIQIQKMAETIPMDEIGVSLRPDQRGVLLKRFVRNESKTGRPLMKPKTEYGKKQKYNITVGRDGRLKLKEHSK